MTKCESPGPNLSTCPAWARGAFTPPCLFPGLHTGVGRQAPRGLDPWAWSLEALLFPCRVGSLR